MRCSARRTLIGATIILAGIIGLNFSSMDAADNSAPVPETDMKLLVDQDIKNIEAMIVVGKKGGAANVSKASRSIRSSSMMIAAYAQSRMGAKGADDAKLASLRDAAIKVGIAAGKKNFADVDGLVKALKANAIDSKANTKKISLTSAIGEFDLEELMFQLKKTSVGGLGTEEEIKAQAKKLTISPENAAALAQRVLILSDYCEVIPIGSGGFNAAKPKKAWDEFNKDMRTAAQGVIAAAGQKNANNLKTAFDKLDRSCVACHEKFK
jgi:Cytochrome C'